jgi:inner membrane transporter RhtA
VTPHVLNRIPGPALVLLAIVSIQGGSALAVTLFAIYDPLALLVLRMTLGAAVLCVVYRRAIAGAVRSSPVGIVALGLTMVVQSGAFYGAIDRIPLGIAASIELLGPLGLALVASRRALDIAIVLVAGAGVALLAPDVGAGLDPLGVACAAAAAAGWAAFILIGRRLGRALEGGVGLALAMATAALMLLPVVGPRALATAAGAPHTLVAVVGVALFASALPLLFEYLALKTVSPTRYGVLLSVEPVVATLIGLVALGQRVAPAAWVAVGLISAASMLAAWFARGEMRGSE